MRTRTSPTLPSRIDSFAESSIGKTNPHSSRAITLVDKPISSVSHRWPRGYANEFSIILSDVFIALLHLITWCIAAIGRSIFWIIRLFALGCGRIVNLVLRKPLEERRSEIVGWILLVTILAVLITSIGFIQNWRFPSNFFKFGSGSSSSTSPRRTPIPYTKPPETCTRPRIACASPTETLDGQPSISADQMLSILKSYNSPSANPDFVQAVYDLGIEYGVNPAYAIGFFVMESSCGTKGRAVDNKSLGNIRYSNDRKSPVTFVENQGFRQYQSWRDGAMDWFFVIRSYYLNRGVRDIYDVTPIYAPSEDHNNPENYASTVYSLVMKWSTQG
jgi:hypothetical protein